MSVALPATPATAAAHGRARWVAWLAAGTLGAAGFALLGTRLASRLPGSLCAFREAAHMSCPTCGMTHALTRLARGDLAGSIAAHPWGVALVLQAGIAWALWGLWLGRRLRERPDRWLPRALGLNVLALLVLWALRAATGTLPPVH